MYVDHELDSRLRRYTCTLGWSPADSGRVLVTRSTGDTGHANPRVLE